MGAAVGESDDGVRIGHQVMERVEVAAGEVEGGHHQYGVAILGHHQVIQVRFDIHAPAPCVRGHGRLRARFIVDRIAEREQVLDALGD